MLYLLLAAFLFSGWMWMRSSVLRRGGWRVGAGLLAAVLVVVGVVVSVRGERFVGLPLVALAVFSAAGGRITRRPSAAPTPEPTSGMTAAEARSSLGVEPSATTDEIKAAYARLMQRAHPDKGGTTGLAAQLNAARDRLLKG